MDSLGSAPQALKPAFPMMGGGAREIQRSLFGVPIIIRLIVFWGLYWAHWGELPNPELRAGTTVPSFAWTSALCSGPRPHPVLDAQLLGVDREYGMYYMGVV